MADNKKNNDPIVCDETTGVFTSVAALEGVTWSRRAYPASQAEKALLPFGIKPSPIGNLQPDGTRLVRYAPQEVPAQDTKFYNNNINITPPSSLQIKAIEMAMKSASNFANLRFERVKAGENPDLIISAGSYKNMMDNGALGFFNPVEKRIVLTEDVPKNSKQLSSEGINVAFHELGHALGLEHPRRYVREENSKNRCEISEAADKNNLQTIMSYDQDARKLVQYAPMDVAALQAIHGVSKTLAAVTIDLDVPLDKSRPAIISVDGTPIKITTSDSKNIVSVDLSEPGLNDIAAGKISLIQQGVRSVEINRNSGYNSLVSARDGYTTFTSLGGASGNYTLMGKGNEVVDQGQDPKFTIASGAQVKINTLASALPVIVFEGDSQLVSDALNVKIAKQGDHYTLTAEQKDGKTSAVEITTPATPKIMDDGLLGTRVVFTPASDPITTASLGKLEAPTKQAPHDFVTWKLRGGIE
jgi:Metallo-peptidase family M12B Reprolysin-like